LKLISFIKSNSFILMITAVLIFSIFLPQAGLLVGKAGITTYLTFIAMFASGLGLSLTNIKDGFKDFKSILFSFSSIYVIFPLITYVILLILNIRSGDIFIGGMILAAQSSTLASAVVLTATANGNVPLALIITIINNMASAVLTPLILKLTLSADQAISIDVGPMILKLLLVLVLPVVLAQVVRKFIKKHMEKITPYRKAVSKIVVLVIVLTGAASASSEIKANIGQALLIILGVAVLHGIMLAIAYLYIRIAKIKHESKSAVLFTASQKTLPASLLIWQNYFAAYMLAPILLVLHHMVQLIIDSVIVSRLSKSNRGKDDEQE
jgi:solute carrier family 10 (sodium/bile acid cotransporter), member 7